MEHESENETGRSSRLSTDAMRSAILASLGLRFGVLLSSALILVGMMILLLSPDISAIQSTISSVLSGAEAVGTLKSLDDILSGVWQGDANAVVTLGLLVLMFTPIVTLFFSLVLFWKERDRPFILIAFCTLAILILGFFWSR